MEEQAIALAITLALVSLGGGLYEYSVVDAAWPRRPFIPKALAFGRADASAIDEPVARAWTRRSLLRLPLELVTCGAMLAAYRSWS